MVGIRTSALLALFGSMVSAGCIGVLKVPLCDPGDAEPDQELVGIWQFEAAGRAEGRGDLVLHIGLAETEVKPDSGDTNFSGAPRAGEAESPGLHGNFMRSVWTERHDDGRLTVAAFVFFPVEIDGVNYVNIPSYRAPRDAEADPGFYYDLMRYRVEDDRLTVWPLGTLEPIETAIEKGDLRGRIITQDSGRYFEIDGIDGLRAFVSTEAGQSIFSDKPLIFRRRKLSGMRNEQITMGVMIALLCAAGLWNLRWLVERTRKGQWLRERFGERRALWVFGGLFALGIAFGVLLATDVIRPVKW